MEQPLLQFCDPETAAQLQFGFAYHQAWAPLAFQHPEGASYFDPLWVKTATGGDSPAYSYQETLSPCQDSSDGSISPSLLSLSPLHFPLVETSSPTSMETPSSYPDSPSLSGNAYSQTQYVYGFIPNTGVEYEVEDSQGPSSLAACKCSEKPESTSPYPRFLTEWIHRPPTRTTIRIDPSVTSSPGGGKIGAKDRHIKNTKDIFVVHISTGPSKTEVSERHVRQLSLYESIPPRSPLFLTASSGVSYSPAEFLSDVVNKQTTYNFVSSVTLKSPEQKWSLSYSLRGATLSPIDPTDSDLLAATSFTFCHFPPDTVYVLRGIKIGSAKWWRQQVCEVRHDHASTNLRSTPGGYWSAQYDDHVEKRRPIRIISHFANCRHRLAEGDEFTLGRLARAVQKGFPPTMRRKGGV